MVADFPYGGAGWQHLKEALSETAGRVGRSDAYKPPATSREIRVSRPPYFIASRSFASVRVRSIPNNI